MVDPSIGTAIMRSSIPEPPGQRSIAPFGSWPSCLSAGQVAESGIRLIDLVIDGDAVVWLESRPAEGGRCVLVRRDRDGTTTDLTPAGFSVRSRVHEYGGQSFAIDQDTVWFCNDGDQRVYRQIDGAAPQAVTAAAALRYAGLIRDPQRGRLICAREDHRGEGEPLNALAAFDETSAEEARVLWQGSDFVDSPALSPDGRWLAWIAWDHPNMPWDETRLWLAEVAADGNLIDPRCLNPGHAESVLEPRWCPAGRLYCISDRSGWWNLHRWHEGALEPVLSMAAEFARAPWQIGQGNYRLISARQALVSWQEYGSSRLGRLDLDTGALRPFDLPYAGVEAMSINSDGRRACFLGATAERGPAVIELDLETGAFGHLSESPGPTLASADIAHAQPFTFATSADEIAHAFFYPPANAAWQAREHERPPAIVLIHGGPTAQTSPCFKPALQFWTQRGFAIIDVDYRGSSGYGRDYRHRLREQWGVLDVEDAIRAARHAVEQGWVDGERLIIRGGSAGGYTVLAALARHDLFAAGANYYGVSDVEALVRDTHKFEARYLDRLIGPYPAQIERYRERSPIRHLDSFDRPLIVFQGLEDKIVPPNQSEAIVEALKARGVPVAYLPFAGEQHGFRRSENQIRALEAELYFYGRVFGFTPADRIEPVPIFNLDDDHQR